MSTSFLPIAPPIGLATSTSVSLPPIRVGETLNPFPLPPTDYLGNIEHLNSIYDSEQAVAIQAISNKRKRAFEDMQIEYERRYHEAFRVVEELGPFFGVSAPPSPGFFTPPSPGMYDNPTEGGEHVNFVTIYDEEEEFGERGEEGKEKRDERDRRSTESEFLVDMKCCVCMDAFRGARLHACNHVSMCMDCAEIGKKERMVRQRGMVRTVNHYWCPICRKFSGHMSKVYFS